MAKPFGIISSSSWPKRFHHTFLIVTSSHMFWKAPTMSQLSYTVQLLDYAYPYELNNPQTNMISLSQTIITTLAKCTLPAYHVTTVQLNTKQSLQLPAVVQVLGRPEVPVWDHHHISQSPVQAATLTNDRTVTTLVSSALSLPTVLWEQPLKDRQDHAMYTVGSINTSHFHRKQATYSIQYCTIALTLWAGHWDGQINSR